MHLFQQYAVKDAAAAATIPVIDYGPTFAGEPGALERLAGQVRHACEHIGFLYVLNHGVPQEVVDRGFAASRRFHALPLAQKLKLRLNQNNIGYMPMNASVQAASQVQMYNRPGLSQEENKQRQEAMKDWQEIVPLRKFAVDSLDQLNKSMQVQQLSPERTQSLENQNARGLLK